MAEELLINDVKIELPQRIVARTLQINDIGEAEDRQANYSNNIKIPPTKNNIKAFEMLGISGNTTRFPYEDMDIKYTVDGIELIQGGKGIIRSTRTFYSLVIYDGNVSMTDILGNKELGTLDWSAHNHTLTESIFTSSFSKTSGYIYGLGRFFEGDLAFSTAFSIDVTSPSFYIHTLIDMIFNQEGWTVSGAFFSDVDFKSRTTTMNNGFERILIEVLTQKYSRNNSGDPLVDDILPIEFDKTYFLDTYNAVTLKTHRANFAGSLDLQEGVNPRAVVYINGVFARSTPIDNPASFDVDIEVFVDSGDEIKTGLIITGEDISGTPKIKFQTNFTTKISENDISIDIDFSLLAGEMKRIDFVKDIMQRFGLIFRKVRNKNEFEFIQIKSLLPDRAGAENWSDKYSNFVEEKYKPNYAKTNIAKYIYDDNDTSTEQTFADGEFLIDNVNIREETTLFTSIFKASELVDSQYYGIKHWNLEEGIIVTNNDGMRLFRANKVSDTIKYKFKLDSGGGVDFTGTVPKLQFLSYQFEISAHYLEFKSMLDDFKMTSLLLNLSIVDIYDMDFFRLKYFDQLGAYYYLNKVVNFKKKKKTRVELIKVGKDVVDALAMVGTYAGSSVYTSLLGKLGAGSMVGTYAGSTTYSSTLGLDAITSFSMSTIGDTEANVCGLGLGSTRFHDGTLALPVINDTIFIDALGATPFAGGDQFYKSSASTHIKVNNSGLVTQEGTCP